MKDIDITPPVFLTPDPDPEIASFYAEDLKLYNDIHHVDFIPILPYGDMSDSFSESSGSLTSIAYWFKRQYWLSNFSNGIKNIRVWFDLIWYDRDWDNNFLWKILLFKLKRMSPAIKEHVAPGPHQVALDRSIVVLEELMKRGNCDCKCLHSFIGEKSKEEQASRSKVCHSCYIIQKELLKEFSDLFVFSNSWWD